MNNTSKPSTTFSQAKRAAILSATIFPGAGLFFLRRYVRGCVFAIPALIVIVMLFKNLFTVAFQLQDQMAAEAAKGIFMPDISHLWNSLHGALFASPYWQQGKWILLASWVLSIISSYFAGQKVDQTTRTE
jgi:ABC-type amino acid transport system permease subunit